MQVKDLLVTGDVKILGNLYSKNGIGSSSGASGDSSSLSSALSNHINAANPHNITCSKIGAATSDHTHNYAGSSLAGGAATSANKVNAALTFNNGGSGAASGTTFDGSTARIISYNTIGAAAASHGNHVPTKQTANNAKFLRNDNTWQTVTPANIGAASATDLATANTNINSLSSNKMDKANPTGTGTVNIGASNTVAGTNTVALGNGNSVSGSYSVALGQGNTVSSTAACALNVYNTADSGQLAAGHGNALKSGGTGTNGYVFVLGNGSKQTKSNALAVSAAGQIYAGSTSISTGADYAEYFEWYDKNILQEDRRGFFVTLEGNKIKIAQSKDYILGIISGQPSIIGNGDLDWQGRFIKDEFGSYIEEQVEEEDEEKDEQTGEIIRKKISYTKWKENPNYDISQRYIERAKRKEWDAVGMLGVLAVRDDGTCEVNGYCIVADGGIATKAETGYRVIERVNDHIVKIVFR